MDEQHTTELMESPLSTKKQKIQGYFNPMEKAIHILLRYASTFEGLFTVPVPEELAMESWKTLSTNASEAQCDLREMDLHILGAGLLLHLKDLNGSLLTNELHDRFVAAAAISSRYSQIYIFRLLLGELPPTNHAILRDLALLLRSTALKNNSNVSKQIISKFGRLLMKRRQSKATVHRQLTAFEAGMLFTMVLMEEWHYLFQYGQASFHGSLAKVCETPGSPIETGLLKTSKVSSSSVNAGGPSARKQGGVRATPCQQDSCHLIKRGNSSQLHLATPQEETKTLNICFEPTSNLDGAIPFNGSLPYTFQLPHGKSISSHNDYLEDKFKFHHGPTREPFDQTIFSPASRGFPISTRSLQVSNKRCDQDTPVTCAISRESADIQQDQRFKDQEVSCDVPSYWKHWFDENDLKSCHAILNYALAKTYEEEETTPSASGNISKTSMEEFHREEDTMNDIDIGKRIKRDGYGFHHTEKEDDELNSDKKPEALVDKGSQAQEILLIHDSNGCSNFKLGTKAIASMEEKTISRSRPSSRKGKFPSSIPCTHSRSMETVCHNCEGLLSDIDRVDDTSKSSSMKSTKSTLSSQRGEHHFCKNAPTFENVVEVCKSLVWGEDPTFGFKEGGKNGLKKNYLGTKRSSKLNIEHVFHNNHDSEIAQLDRDCESLFLYPEDGQPASTDGDNEKSGINVEKNKSSSGFSKNHGNILRSQGYGPSNVKPKDLSRNFFEKGNVISASSKYPKIQHGERNAHINSMEELDDEPSSLSLSCMDRLQACVENVMRCKENKSGILRAPHQDQLQDKGGKSPARLLNSKLASLKDCEGSQASQCLLAKALGAPSCSYDGFQKNEAKEHNTRIPASLTPLCPKPSDSSNELAKFSMKPEWEEVQNKFNFEERNEGVQLLLAPSDLNNINQQSLLDTGISDLPSKSPVGVDTECQYMESARGGMMLTYSKNTGKNTTGTITHTKGEAIIQDSLSTSIPPNAAQKMYQLVDLPNSSTEKKLPTDTDEDKKLGNPDLGRDCERICSSLTQSRKSIGVLGATNRDNHIVTSVLPILQPSSVLDEQDSSSQTKSSFFECRDGPERMADKLTHDSNSPSIPPGQTPGRPLPCPPPPPPPPPPPRPHPRSLGTSPPMLKNIPLPTAGPPLSTPQQTLPLTRGPASALSTPPPKAPPLPPNPPPPPVKKPTIPPPPPLGKRNSLSAVQAKRPKMKHLVWDKIAGSMADLTIWKTTTPSEIKMDLKELETLFAVKDTPQSQPKIVTVRKKTQGVQILDLKRAHNIGIQLRSLRKPIPELCHALLHKDEAMLTMEVLTVMLNTLPNEEDVTLLQGYQGDKCELAEVEMYYMELLKIPRYEKLIKVFIFKGQYNLNFHQIEQELKLLGQACNQLKSSESFKKILETVLAVGNHLNGDSFHGAAKGFKLGALLKLMDVKSHNKKTTLLHFVVDSLIRKDDKAVKLIEESRAAKAAANLSLERLQLGLRELENGLDLIKVEISLAKQASPGDQQLMTLMMPFYEKVTMEVIGLRTLHDTALANLKDLAIYFGETLKQERLIDLFKTMREFFFMLDQVTLELREAKRREIEIANKKSQGNSSYSCPASPAHKLFKASSTHKASRRGAQRLSQSLCSVEVPKDVQIGSDPCLTRRQIDLDVVTSSLLHDENSSSFLQLSLSNKFDEEGVSSSNSTIGHQQELSNSGQNSICTVSTLDLGDKITEIQDHLSIDGTSYDSDWSTG